MFNPGDCLIIEGDYRVKGVIATHLFIVLIELEENTGNTIIVSVQTIRGGRYDRTTILQPGDHEFIKRPSFINYRYAEIISANTLEEWIKSGKASNHTPLEVNGEVFQSIRGGLLKSKFTKIEVVDMYNDLLFN